MDNIHHYKPVDVWRNPHLWRIAALMMACSVFYYLDAIIELAGWPKLQWGIFYTVHDLHRLLFLIPVLYAAHRFRVKGVIVTTLIAMLIFLPHAMFVSPYPEALIKAMVFAIFIAGISILLSKLLDNITEHKRVEEAMRASEEKTRSLIDDVLDSSGVGIIILDADFRIVWVNLALERYFGLRRDEVVGKDERVLIRQRIKYIFEDPESFANKMLAGYDDNTYVENFECHALPDPDSRREERWLEHWSLPIRSGLYAGGRIEHCYDITRRKRIEEEQESLVSAYQEQNQVIATYNTELEGALARAKQVEERLQAVYQREKELRQELENEIKKRAEFTRALVHELKTPLVPVMSSSDILVDGLKEEPWLSLARNVNRGASNLNSRIDELLDISRGELGMLEVDPKPVDPLPILREVAGEMGSVASSHEQSLITDLPSSLATVQADESRLRQVLLNLLGNASKFTPEGGKITLRAKEKAGSIVVEVQDTGPGIAEKEQERLFEPYYRVEADRQRFKGLGLGLALCKRLVELHGGQIWAKSQKGKGATFSFSVPLVATNQQVKKRKGEKL